MVEVVSVVIGALGSATKEFDGWIEKLRVTKNDGAMRKTALFRTTRILRCKKEIILSFC